MGRILAVDPGEKRIGLAISDPEGIFARPLGIIAHINRLTDAASIARIAEENSVELIIIGQALNSDGYPGHSARKAGRLAEVVRSQTELPVQLWDESESTLIAEDAWRKMGVRRSRRGSVDAMAAVVILQSYLDSKQ